MGFFIVLCIVIFIIGIVVSKGKSPGDGENKKEKIGNKVMRWLDDLSNDDDEEDEDDEDDEDIKFSSNTATATPVSHSKPTQPAFNSFTEPKVVEKTPVKEIIEAEEINELDKNIDNIASIIPAVVVEEQDSLQTTTNTETNQNFIYSFIPLENTEISKYYVKNNLTLLFQTAEETILDNEKYSGKMFRINDGKYYLIDLALKDLSLDFYSPLGYTSNDKIKLAIIIDNEKKLIDLSIVRENNNSFVQTEKGNFLFCYPEFRNIGLSFGQFSYYKASEITKLLFQEFEYLTK